MIRSLTSSPLDRWHQRSSAVLLVAIGWIACVVFAASAGCQRPSADPDRATQATGDRAEETGDRQVAKKPFGLVFEREYPKHSFSVTPLVVGQRLILADFEGRITSVDLKSGETQWEFQGDKLGYEAPVVFDGEHLYAAAFEGIVDCLDVNSGESIWSFPCEEAISAPPLIHGDNLLIGTQAATLFCLDKTTGKEIWKFKATDQIVSAPRVQGDRILVMAACSRLLHIVDLKSGEELSQIELPGESASPLIVDGEKLYVTTMYGDALCYDWQNVKELWSYRFNPELEPQIEGGPLLDDGVIYVGGTDSFIRALNIESQKEMWARRVKGGIKSPLVMSADVVVATTERGRLYIADKSTGKLLWQYESNGDFLAPPLLHEDTLIIANNEGMVYRFGPLSSIEK